MVANTTRVVHVIGCLLRIYLIYILFFPGLMMTSEGFMPAELLWW